MPRKVVLVLVLLVSIWYSSGSGVSGPTNKMNKMNKLNDGDRSADPPYPWLPQNVYSDLAEVRCTNVGPGCSAFRIQYFAQGASHIWWAFDDSGAFISYREDGVLGTKKWIFNREIANVTGSTEWYLETTVDPKLGCETTNITTPANMHAKFPRVTYAGTGTYLGTPVHIWHDPWTVLGKPAIAEIFVSQETGLFYGWSLEKSIGGPGYVYYRWQDMGPKLDPSIYDFPNIQCSQSKGNFFISGRSPKKSNP